MPEENEPSPPRRPEDTMETAEEGTHTLVCLKCGEEYYFSEDPPQDLKCEQCGGHTFRSFYTADEDDEVAADFEEETSRDTDPDDDITDISPEDLSDLRRL